MNGTIYEWIFGSGIGLFILKDLVLYAYRKNDKVDADKMKKIEDCVNILWDSHNQKKDESTQLKALQENFTLHERKFEIFAATQANSNVLFSKQIEDVKALIIHKENGQQTVTSGIFKVLERIEDKLDEKQ